MPKTDQHSAAKNYIHPSHKLSFVECPKEGGINWWNVPTPRKLTDEPCGEGCSKGYELAGECLSYIKSSSDAHPLNSVLSAMPWNMYNNREHITKTGRRYDVIAYQKGVMVGFLSILDRFVEFSVQFADPSEYVIKHQEFYEQRMREVEEERRAMRSAAAIKGWKTRKAKAA